MTLANEYIEIIREETQKNTSWSYIYYQKLNVLVLPITEK